MNSLKITCLVLIATPFLAEAEAETIERGETKRWSVSPKKTVQVYFKPDSLDSGSVGFWFQDNVCCGQKSSLACLRVFCMDSRGEWHLVSRGESMFLDFPARAYRFDIVFYADAFKQKAEVSLQVFQKGRPDKLTEELVRKGVITEEELARQSAQDKRKRAAEEQVSFKSRSLSLLYSLRNSYLHRDIEEEKNLYFAQREAFEGKRGSPAAFESVKRIMEDKERVAVAKLLILQFRYSRDSGIRKAAKEALEASSKKETYLNGLPVASYETAARHSAKFVPQEVFYGPRALQLDSNLGKKIVSFVEAVEKSSFKQSVVYDALAAKVGAKRAEEIIEQIDLSVFSGPNWRSKLETLLLGTPGIVPNE